MASRLCESPAESSGEPVTESFCSAAAELSSTKRAASASSGSSMVMVTSAMPIGGTLDGAVENAIGHALGAQGFVALLAEDPTDGVNDVGFAAAVGPDDARGAGAAERHHGAFAERLEAYDFNFAQLEQGVPSSRSLLLRGAGTNGTGPGIRPLKAGRGPGTIRTRIPPLQTQRTHHQREQNQPGFLARRETTFLSSR